VLQLSLDSGYVSTSQASYSNGILASQASQDSVGLLVVELDHIRLHQLLLVTLLQVLQADTPRKVGQKARQPLSEVSGNV
jgi:hypothetical protein